MIAAAAAAAGCSIGPWSFTFYRPVPCALEIAIGGEHLRGDGRVAF